MKVPTSMYKDKHFTEVDKFNKNYYIFKNVEPSKAEGVVDASVVTNFLGQKLRKTAELREIDTILNDFDDVTTEDILKFTRHYNRQRSGTNVLCLSSAALTLAVLAVVNRSNASRWAHSTPIFAAGLATFLAGRLLYFSQERQLINQLEKSALINLASLHSQGTFLQGSLKYNWFDTI